MSNTEERNSDFFVKLKLEILVQMYNIYNNYGPVCEFSCDQFGMRATYCDWILISFSCDRWHTRGTERQIHFSN